MVLWGRPLLTQSGPDCIKRISLLHPPTQSAPQRKCMGGVRHKHLQDNVGLQAQPISSVQIMMLAPSRGAAGSPQLREVPLLFVAATNLTKQVQKNSSKTATRLTWKICNRERKAGPKSDGINVVLTDCVRRGNGIGQYSQQRQLCLYPPTTPK